MTFCACCRAYAFRNNEIFLSFSLLRASTVWVGKDRRRFDARIECKEREETRKYQSNVRGEKRVVTSLQRHCDSSINRMLNAIRLFALPSSANDVGGRFPVRSRKTLVRLPMDTTRIAAGTQKAAEIIFLSLPLSDIAVQSIHSIIDLAGGRSFRNGDNLRIVQYCHNFLHLLPCVAFTDGCSNH